MRYRIVLFLAALIGAATLVGASAADPCACGGDVDWHAQDSCQAPYPVSPNPGYTHICWNQRDGWHGEIRY